MQSEEKWQFTIQNEVRDMEYKDFYVTLQKGCDPSKGHTLSSLETLLLE